MTNASRHELHFFEAAPKRTNHRARGWICAVRVFVNDLVDRSMIEKLAAAGVRLIALRCAGYNNVDLAAARKHSPCATTGIN